MKTRRVHIVICYNHTLQSTYISEVCSNKKKAEDHKEYISALMHKDDPDTLRTYWVMSQRVV
jgi:hypothetical protein